MKTIRVIVTLASISSIGYGLWLFHPGLAFVGIGGLILADIIHGMRKDTQNDSR